jgi:hypothetical protein
MAIYSSPQGWLAANAGEPLNNISFGNAINLTDGSWTLLDPDGLIQSISYAAGYHTVVWNDLLAGSANYNWSSGTVHRAPRWYKDAEVNNIQIVSDDIVQAMFYLQVDNAFKGDFSNAIINGICVDPTSTASTNIAGMGSCHNIIAPTGNPALGVWAINGSSTSSAGAPTRSIVTSQYGGQHVGSAVFTNLNAGGVRVQNGSRNGNIAIASSVNLKWIVGLGTRSNTDTITLGDESQRFKLYHKAVKMNIGAIL